MGFRIAQLSAGRRAGLFVRTGCLGLAAVCAALALGPVNVMERSYNRFRTGANTSETILTPTNVASTANQFHKQFVMKVDGKIEGSPLYASSIQIAGGTHNVVYVATMHNTVYAFDADSGNQLSAQWLGTPVTASTWKSQAGHHSHRVWDPEHPGDRPGHGNAVRRALGLRKRNQRADLPPLRPRYN